MASQSSLDCSDAAGEVNSICIHHISIKILQFYVYVTHVVDSEVVQSLCDLNLLLGIEERIGELFTLPQSTLNNLEISHIAQEVADRLVRVVSSRVRVIDSGEARMSCA